MSAARESCGAARSGSPCRLRPAATRAISCAAAASASASGAKAIARRDRAAAQELGRRQAPAAGALQLAYAQRTFAAGDQDAAGVRGEHRAGRAALRRAACPPELERLGAQLRARPRRRAQGAQPALDLLAGARPVDVRLLRRDLLRVSR